VSVADSTGNPYDLAYAFYMAAHYALLNGSPAEAERASLQAIRLSDEHGYSALADATGAMLGRARAGLGHASEGAAMIDRSVHQRRRVRRNGSDTMYLTWLAEAYAMAGDSARAEAALEEALTVNPLETFYRPETLRLRGDLRRAQARPADAKADYEAALALARSIGAVAFARRAISSLAGLQGSLSRALDQGAD
jgi:tetratricopeptide (TPR) repeat protein